MTGNSGLVVVLVGSLNGMVWTLWLPLFYVALTTFYSVKSHSSHRLQQHKQLLKTSLAL